MPQTIYSFFYPASKKWQNVNKPPEDWRVLPGPPYINIANPEPPYPGFWYEGQPHESMPWTSKSIGAFPPSKIHMWPEDLVSFPKFGVMHIDQNPTWTWPMMPTPKSWIKVRMLGQETPFFVHIITEHDDGTVTRQVVKVRPKKNMQNWRQYENEARAASARSDMARARAEKLLTERADKINQRLQELGEEPQ